MSIGPKKLIRSPKQVDENFILSSYLKSFRCSNDNIRMTNDIYFYNFKKCINNLIKTARVAVLCDVNDEDLVYGYCIYDTYDEILILHYVYVRYTFRKLGFARFLFDEIVGDHTAVVSSHANRVFDELRNNPKYKHIDYNPFLRKI